MEQQADFIAIARHIRRQLVEMSHRANAAHLGSALSCVDILVAAYWASGWRLRPELVGNPERDRLILSKGHAASALYAALASRGFFSAELLTTYGQQGCCLPEHPGVACVPGVEAATGSLGHGLSIAIGMALAARIQKRDSRIMAILSDGECNEGSVWEAAMFAPSQALHGVTVVVDCNGWQATGRSNEVLALQPLGQKWQAFGWRVVEVPGHDIGQLAAAMSLAPDEAGRPTAIIAHTIKGKGVSFMEDDNNWHYRSPNDKELAAALKELEA